jgi:hypothetical protein
MWALVGVQVLINVLLVTALLALLAEQVWALVGVQLLINVLHVALVKLVVSGFCVKHAVPSAAWQSVKVGSESTVRLIQKE